MPQYWEDFKDIADINNFKTSAIYADDRYRLDLYECGEVENSTCLIIPPPCSPFLVFSRLALALSKRHRVISWETRGSPYINQAERRFSFELGDYVADIEKIIIHSNVKQANVITFCESFAFLPKLLEGIAMKTSFIANIAPSINYRGHKSPARIANKALVESILDDNLSAAREAFEKYMAMRRLSIPTLSDNEQIINRILSLPLQDFESARHFLRVVKLFEDNIDLRKNIRSCNEIESLFIQCLDDKVADFRSTLKFFEELNQGTLILKRTGGHSYFFHQADELSKEISDFFHA